MYLERLVLTNAQRLGAQTTTTGLVDSRLDDAEAFEALMARGANFAAWANRAGA